MKRAWITLLAAVSLGLLGSSIAAAQIPLTPIIEVVPTSLDFGRVCVGQTRDLTVDLSNGANDPTSILTITNLTADAPFTLVNPPATPFDIPGDGSTVTLTVRFSPNIGGPVSGNLTITGEEPIEGDNPRIVPLAGVGNRAPTCNAGGPYSGQIGEAIQFDGTGSSDPDGDPLTYLWDFGDGSTATGPSPAHAYATSGVFTVTLGVNDGCATSICETTATINAPPLCDADGPYSGDVGESITFDGSGSSDPDGTIVSYAWNFGDGNVGSGPNPTHTYNTPGVFVVTLTVTDNDGGTASCETTADINAPPVCDADGPYSGNVGESITFDGSGSGDDGDIVSYAWDFGDGSTGSGVNPTHTYNTSGLFTVTLTVTDDDGATATCTTTADINASPICDAGGPYSGLVGQPVQFDGSGSSDPDGTIVNYAWDFGDGGTGSGPNPTHTYNATGAFTVTLVVTDNDAATSTCETTANIGEGNLPPICDAGGPYTGTVGVPVQFDGSGSSDPDGTIVSYAWDFGDGNTGSGVNPTHTYNAAGNFVVTLTVTDNDDASSTCTTTATISPVNQPPVCDANGPYQGDVNTPIQFDGSGSSDSDGTIVSYAWDFGDGSTGTGVNPTHTYTTDGNFIATLCVTDDDGAESCCEATVTVFPPSAVELSSFTASSGGGTVTLQWSTSFEEHNSHFIVERADRGSDAYTRLQPQVDVTGNGDTPGSYSFVDRSVEPGNVYQYRLVAVDRSGGEQRLSRTIEVAVSTTVPERLVLNQNNPNPFNPSTSISFALPEGGKVALRIYDAQGHLVRTLVDRDLPAESHVVEWDGKDNNGLSVGSGVYLYRLETARAVLQNKMVLMK